MATSKEKRRECRRAILSALYRETHSYGGDIHKERVKHYLSNPGNADTEAFYYVGQLHINYWYISPQKPTLTEKRALWSSIESELNVDIPFRDNWNKDTKVTQLQYMIELAMRVES